MSWLLVIACVVAVWYYRNYKGAMRMYQHEKMLNILSSGEHYRRLVGFTHNGRKYEARVRRWNVPEAGPGIAELWCIEGSNPDGWTQFFFWDKRDLELL